MKLADRVLAFISAAEKIAFGYNDDKIVVAGPPLTVVRNDGHIVLRLGVDGAIAQISDVDSVYEHVLFVASSK